MTAAKMKLELKKSNERILELNTLFLKLYEDNALGKITDDQFALLASDFDRERHKLEGKVTELNKKIEVPVDCSLNAKKFAALCKKTYL